MGLGKTLTILSYLKMLKDEREDRIHKKINELLNRDKARKNEKDNDNDDDENDNNDNDNVNEKEEDEEDEYRASKEYAKKMNYIKKYSNAKRVKKPLKTLIILPASLLHQWQGEINSRFESGSFKFHVYHDANRKKYSYNLEDNDIVFTTYEIASRELSTIVMDNTEDSRASSMVNDSPLAKIEWKRIILDEAHRIKNHTTKASKVICSLKAKYRIAITGKCIL
jgi:transcription termination factor 2